MTPREPDRFEVLTVEQLSCLRTLIGDYPTRLQEEHFASALRAAELSALERAAQVAKPYCYTAAAHIRALIPPAAAPAACPRCDPEMPGLMWNLRLDRHVPCTDPGHDTPARPRTRSMNASGLLPRILAALQRMPQPHLQALASELSRHLAAAPAAETRCPFNEQDCLGARQRIAELERKLRVVCDAHSDLSARGLLGDNLLDECERTFRTLPLNYQPDELLATLAARAAPPEGEGT